METTILLRCLGNLFHRLTLLRCGAPLLLGCPLQEDSRRNQNRGFPGGTPPICWSAKWKISFTFKTFSTHGFRLSRWYTPDMLICKISFRLRTKEISMFCSYFKSLIKNSALSCEMDKTYICKWYIRHTSHLSYKFIVRWSQFCIFCLLS